MDFQKSKLLPKMKSAILVENDAKKCQLSKCNDLLMDSGKITGNLWHIPTHECEKSCNYGLGVILIHFLRWSSPETRRFLPVIQLFLSNYHQEWKYIIVQQLSRCFSKTQHLVIAWSIAKSFLHMWRTVKRQFFIFHSKLQSYGGAIFPLLVVISCVNFWNFRKRNFW